MLASSNADARMGDFAVLERCSNDVCEGQKDAASASVATTASLQDHFAVVR